MSRSRTIRAVLLFVGLFSFYVLGVLVRRGYGIGVVVRNASQETLRQVSIKIESIGDRRARYRLPDLRPGDRRRIFVRPVTESHINLEFTDSSNRQHVETVYGYAEAGYCGTATATILPGDKIASMNAYDLNCLKSWLDFI